MDPRQLQANAAASAPSAPASPSVGYPTNGNPATSTPATQPGDYWFHQVGEEIRNAIDESGLTPNHLDLTQLAQAIRPERPLAAIPYPTIGTASHRFTVTPAALVNGGTVSIPADVYLSLGVEVVSGETGRLRVYKTAAYTSADLDVSSTYYLRAKVTSNALEVYVQKGTDSDGIPGSLIGSPGGASGGGFDSTVLDVLIAKVETGTATTVPTVTTLANHAHLHAEVTYAGNTTAGTSGVSNFTTDWGRIPSIFAFRQINAELDGTNSEALVKAVMSPFDRYGFTAEVRAYYTSGPDDGDFLAPAYVLTVEG